MSKNHKDRVHGDPRLTRHRHELVALAAGYLRRDHAAAEDVAQAVVEKLLKRRKPLPEDDGALRSLMRSVAVNTAREWARGGRRERARCERAARSMVLEREVVDAALRPERLQGALSGVAPETLALVVALKVDGVPMREVVAESGLTERTVRYRVAGALAALRDAMEKRAA